MNKDGGGRAAKASAKGSHDVVSRVVFAECQMG